jgi:predicted enzyme related to lactoylglutathione lyase
MSEASEHRVTPTGQFTWTDVGTPDIDAAKSFYGGLFGWEFEGGGEEFGGYTTAIKDGKGVAGLMPLVAAEQPAAWTLYVAVDDTDTAAKIATENGATPFMEPMDVGALGRMWVAADPTGAAFGLWQHGEHTGFQRVGAPGATCWYELATRDHARANDFYSTFLPWSYEQIGDGANFDYTQIKVGDETAGGTMAMTDDVPAEMPSFWLVYFAVEDTDAACDYVTKNGGDVAREPVDSPYGRFAPVRDPWGAHFGVIRLPDVSR